MILLPDEHRAAEKLFYGAELFRARPRWLQKLLASPVSGCDALILATAPMDLLAAAAEVTAICPDRSLDIALARISGRVLCVRCKVSPNSAFRRSRQDWVRCPACGQEDAMLNVRRELSMSIARGMVRPFAKDQGEVTQDFSARRIGCWYLGADLIA